jgi:hypothetical protein
MIDSGPVATAATPGEVTTVAGNVSQMGYWLGDGYPATCAGLGGPYGVAVDADGNLYIADRDTNRIRKVDTREIITTVAGNVPITASSLPLVVNPTP